MPAQIPGNLRIGPITTLADATQAISDIQSYLTQLVNYLQTPTAPNVPQFNGPQGVGVEFANTLTLRNAPVPFVATGEGAYTWVDCFAADGTKCVFPIFLKA